MTNCLVIQHVNELFHKGRDKVFESELSSFSNSGIEFAAAILYADYLGIRVIGRIPAWVRRLRQFPNQVPPALCQGVRKVLDIQNVLLTDSGELVRKKTVEMKL